MSQLIDRVAYYQIPMTLSQAYAWFKQHPQHGFTASGTTVASDRSGDSMYGFEYDPSPLPHWPWGQANLEIGLAPQGQASTAIRVDGVAQWIDPSPIRDTSHGPDIRVTIAGGCPPTIRGRTDITNPNASDLDHQLLPTMAPVEALRCTYNGMNGHAFALASRQRLNASQALAAAAQIMALPLGNRGTAVIHCPMDDDRATILVFGYSGRADVDIWQHTSGCASTDNGHIVSSGF